MRVRIIEPVKKHENKKKRVCAYARVSTGSEAQGESLENQIQYYENLISNNPDYEYAGVFADRGITGTTDNRPEFQRMLNLAKEGKIDLIITKSISRFARNTAIMLQIVRELKDIGVEIIFEKENIKTLSGDGELIINTTRFLGYDKDEYGDLVINPKEAEIVKRIFEDYLKGKGTFTIAKELNEDKVPTVAGGRWQESTILNILKNEKYKGDAILQKYYTPDHLRKVSVRNEGIIDSYYIEDNHSPIVSREMWEQVQIEIAKRAKAKGNKAGDTKKYTNRYPLTGMLYCSKCGSVLRRRTWNSKHSCRKIVWQCSNYIKNGKDACSGTSIDDEIISRLNIEEPITVREEVKDGKKHYSYTCKSKQEQSGRANTAAEKENGSLLQGINRSIRTVIKL